MESRIRQLNAFSMHSIVGALNFLIYSKCHLNIVPTRLIGERNLALIDGFIQERLAQLNSMRSGTIHLLVYTWATIFVLTHIKINPMIARGVNPDGLPSI